MLLVFDFRSEADLAGMVGLWGKEVNSPPTAAQGSLYRRGVLAVGSVSLVSEGVADEDSPREALLAKGLSAFAVS